jgi:hypothetical protein
VSALHTPADRVPGLSPALLDGLLDEIADKLAPRVAEEVVARLGSPAPSNGLGMAGRLTLDELVAELPKSKAPKTWKSWLYEHLRRGDVPGAVKLAGDWYLDAEKVKAWLERDGE